MIITTADTYEQKDTITNGGLIDINKKEGQLKDYQKVLEVGPMVKGIEVGDTVVINPAAYAVWAYPEKKSEEENVEAYGKKQIVDYKFITEEVDDQLVLCIYDRDVFYVVEGEEIDESPTSSVIYTKPQSKLIV